MGGYGSGRPWGYGKTTVEDCLILDINKLVRDRLLYAGIHKSGNLTWRNTRTGESVSSVGFEVNASGKLIPWLRLFYNMTRTGEKVDFKIYLNTTRPNFGGIRWWFICPLMGCNRRVTKLHSPPGGKYFGCRECYDLTYTSCQDSHKFDALYAEIAKDVGVTPDFVKRVITNKI